MPAVEDRTAPGTRRLEPRPTRIPDVRLDHLWMAIPFLLVVWLTAYTRLPALDFWWHLKAGEIIWSTGSIPTDELFSYTAAGKTFVLQNWLAEVVYYLVYRAGGPSLIVALNTLLLLATLLPVYLLAHRRSNSTLVAALTTCAAAFPVAMTQGNIRPGVFSFVLFAWFSWILFEFRAARQKVIWFLPVLMVLWVNLHGAFVLGIGLVVLYLAVETAAAFFFKGETQLGNRERGRLLLVLGLLLGATLINPQFFQLYDYVLIVTRDPISRALITEWQAPRITQVNDLVRFFGLFFLGLFILLRSRKRPEMLDIVLFFSFAAFALSAKRNGAWFAIVAGPILAAYLPPWRSRQIATGFTRVFNLVLAIVLTVVTIRAVPWVRELTAPPPERRFVLLDSDLPVRTADYMGSARLEGRVFHPQNWGDYLVWRLWPMQRSFLDGRVHVFDLSVARDYLAIMRPDADWQQRLDKYQVHYVLLNRKNGDQSRLIEQVRTSAQWKVRYEDERSILFERREGRR